MDLAMGEFLAKARVYVKDPSEAPEGANVQRGPRGGYYFEDGGKKAPAEEEAPEGAPAPAAEPAPETGVPNQGTSIDPATGQPDMLMEPEEWESRSGVDGQILNLLENNQGIPDAGTPDRAALNTMVARMAELTGDDPYEIAQEYASDADVWAREEPPKTDYEYEDQPEGQRVETEGPSEGREEALSERGLEPPHKGTAYEAELEGPGGEPSEPGEREPQHRGTAYESRLDDDEYGESNSIPQDSSWTDFATMWDIGELDLDEFADKVSAYPGEFKDFKHLERGIGPQSLYREDPQRFIDALQSSSLAAAEADAVEIEETFHGWGPQGFAGQDPIHTKWVGGAPPMDEDERYAETERREAEESPFDDPYKVETDEFDDLDVDEYGEKPGQYPGGLHEEEWNALSKKDQLKEELFEDVKHDRDATPNKRYTLDYDGKHYEGKRMPDVVKEAMDALGTGGVPSDYPEAGESREPFPETDDSTEPPLGQKKPRDLRDSGYLKEQLDAIDDEDAKLMELTYNDFRFLNFIENQLYPGMGKDYSKGDLYNMADDYELEHPAPEGHYTYHELADLLWDM